MHPPKEILIHFWKTRKNVFDSFLPLHDLLIDWYFDVRRPGVNLTKIQNIFLFMMNRQKSFRLYKDIEKMPFFRNKTFLFFKIESWNFQHLFEIEFRETSKNFNLFSSFRQFFFKQMLEILAVYLEKQKRFYS